MIWSRDSNSNSSFFSFLFFPILSFWDPKTENRNQWVCCVWSLKTFQWTTWMSISTQISGCLFDFMEECFYFLFGSWFWSRQLMLPGKWRLVEPSTIANVNKHSLKRAWSYGWPFGDGKNIGNLSLDRWHTLVGRKCSDDWQKSRSEGKECRGRVVLGGDSVFKFGTSKMEPEKSWPNTRLFSWSLSGLYVITSFKQACC